MPGPRSDTAQILAMHRKGYTQKEIGAEFGIAQQTVSRIITVHEKRWREMLAGATDAREVLLDNLLDITAHGKDSDRIKAADAISKMLGLNAPEQVSIKQDTGAIQIRYVDAPMPEFRHNPIPAALNEAHYVPDSDPAD